MTLSSGLFLQGLLVSAAVCTGASHQRHTKLRSNCLDFVMHDFLPKCHKGSFLCIGDTDDSCHAGENQLQVHVKNKGPTDVRDRYQVALVFENDGFARSKINTIWIEDEYILLKKFYTPQPIVNSPGVKYQIMGNSTVFGDALAHHLHFDQHFVASCTMSNGDLHHFRGISKLRGERSTTCVKNTGTDDRSKHDSVTLLFESSCTATEVEEAISVGLIRVGVQMDNFKTTPRTKSFISCQDVVEVETFEEGDGDHHMDEMYEYDEEDFFTDSDDEDFMADE